MFFGNVCINMTNYCPSDLKINFFGSNVMFWGQASLKKSTPVVQKFGEHLCFRKKSGQILLFLLYPTLFYTIYIFFVAQNVNSE